MSNGSDVRATRNRGRLLSMGVLVGLGLLTGVTIARGLGAAPDLGSWQALDACLWPFGPTIGMVLGSDPLAPKLLLMAGLLASGLGAWRLLMARRIAPDGRLAAIAVLATALAAPVAPFLSDPANGPLLIGLGLGMGAIASRGAPRIALGIATILLQPLAALLAAAMHLGLRGPTPPIQTRRTLGGALTCGLAIVLVPVVLAGPGGSGSGGSSASAPADAMLVGWAIACLAALPTSRRRETFGLLTGAAALATGVLTLNPQAGATNGTLALLFAGGGLLAAASLHATRTRPVRHAVVLGGLGLAILTGQRTALEDGPERAQEQALLATFEAAADGLDAAPDATDLVTGLGSGEHDVLIPILPGLWAHPSVASARGLPLPAIGERVRLFRWAPTVPQMIASIEDWRLRPLLDARVASPESLRLEAPQAEATSPSSAAGEPTFIWSVSADADPGFDGFRFIGQAISKEHPREGLRARHLDESVLSRTERDGRVHYAWRPSLRSRSGEIALRELYWEDGDLVLPGHQLTWTIAMKPSSPGTPFLIAPPHALQNQ